MIGYCVVCLASVRRYARFIVVAVMAPLAVLGVAAPAVAAPQGDYAVFSQCPTGTPGLSICTFAQITSGEFVLGKMSVPIDKTITLQSGGIEIEAGIYAAIPPANGEALSKTELNIPGGLSTLVDCREIKGRRISDRIERHACKAILGDRVTGVTATIEAVASPSNPAILSLRNILEQQGAALTLPARVHLNNPRLGGGCYIGSESSPIELHLTVGETSPPEPNKPITGKIGTLSEEEEVTVLTGVSLVDNTFSVPVAEGCGGPFSSIVDPLIDAKLGLPSNAGYNTAILTGTHRLALVESVVKNEASTAESEKPERPPHHHHWIGQGPGRGL